MAGYSGKPLIAKLGLRSNQRLRFIGAPSGFADVLRPLPGGAVIVSTSSGSADCVVLFATSEAGLADSFAPAAACLPPAGVIWVAWPKQASRRPTDLNGNVVRRIGLERGLADVRVCAISEIWSGLKFVRRLRDRGR